MAKRKRDLCKARVVKFLTETTSHGCPQIIIVPKKWMKLVWIPLVLVAMGMSCLQIALLIQKYLSYPIEVERTVSIKMLTIKSCSIQYWYITCKCVPASEMEN